MRQLVFAFIALFPLANALAQPRFDTSSLKPLTELGTDKYKDFEGGLYPGGRNDRPAEHEAAGVKLAQSIQPLDPDGKPYADGAIVLLSIGMSNTTQEFRAFQQMAAQEKNLNPHLKLVDGAQGGMTAAMISQPSEPRGKQFWDIVSRRVQQSSVTPQQVQVIWLKEADARPTAPFPEHAKRLESELEQIVQLAHEKFPNLRLAYVSSRIFAGNATTPLNPEPYAYESGFAVKWLIEKQINGDPLLKSPWLSWGPYLWTNGQSARADGLVWNPEDFGPDGTHPSALGRQKVAKLLLAFFKTDSTSKPWFVKMSE